MIPRLVLHARHTRHTLRLSKGEPRNNNQGKPTSLNQRNQGNRLAGRQQARAVETTPKSKSAVGTPQLRKGETCSYDSRLPYPANIFFSRYLLPRQLEHWLQGPFAADGQSLQQWAANQPPRPRSKGRLRSRTTQAGERGPASTPLASWRLVGEAGGSGKRAAWYQHRTRRDLPQQSWSDSPRGAVLPAAGLPN